MDGFWVLGIKRVVYMAKLPQRPRNQVLEIESQKFVKGILPSEWIVIEPSYDYGIDLDVEIVEKTFVTGVHFLMQLKSTDKIQITKDGFVLYNCKTSTLRYFWEQNEQVVFLVYDAKNKIGYWIWIKDYITNDLARNTKWKKQKTVAVKISKDNFFTEKSIGQIKARVMKLHRQANLLDTIQTLNNPYVNYAVQFDGNNEIIAFSPKYPGAERDYPMTFDLTFKFDRSSSAQQAHQALQDAMKKGLPAEIDSKFIENVEFPELLSPELFSHDEFKPDKLFIMPISQNRTVPAAVTILGQNEEILSNIPFVDFKEKRSGSEEIMFSNDGQQIPVRFSMTANQIEHKVSFSFHVGFVNLNVFQALEMLKFQKAVATGSWIRVTHLSTNTTLIKSEIPENLISQPPDILIEVAGNLSHIQEKTGQIIPWPEKISFDEKELIDEILRIIDTGLASGGNYLSFGLNKETAQRLATSIFQTERSNFRLEAERFANLFGQRINLGPVSFMLLGAKLSAETINRLSALNEISDDAPVKIELEVDDLGIKIYHHKWLPPHIKDSLNLNQLP
jgi:hypothetical protein